MGNEEENKEKILIIYHERYTEQVNRLKEFREGGEESNYGQNFSVTLKQVSETDTFVSLHNYVFKNFKAQSSDSLAKYVLLVGTIEEVPTYMRGGINESGITETVLNQGVYSAASDITYGFRNYNVYTNQDKSTNYELIVGRLSSGDEFYHKPGSTLTNAEKIQNIKNQVDKIIAYEQMIDKIKDGTLTEINLAENKFRKVIGIASSEGAGDGIDNLSDNLYMRGELTQYVQSDLNMKGVEFFQDSLTAPDPPVSGMTYDNPYSPNSNNLISSINDGSSLLLYAGHASEIALSTSGLSTSNISNITEPNTEFDDDPKYFLGCIVGCSLGSHDENYMSLAEALTLKPKSGAISMFSSSILQSWLPPMYMQRNLRFTITQNSSDNPINTIGELFKESVVQPNFMGAIDFWFYHIFGDPATRYVLLQDELKNSSGSEPEPEPEPESESCSNTSVTLILKDRYGDGWNGKILTMTKLGIDGEENITNTAIGDYTFDTGYSKEFSLCLEDGCYLVECSGGSWPYETSFEIKENLANGVSNIFRGSTRRFVDK